MDETYPSEDLVPIEMNIYQPKTNFIDEHAFFYKLLNDKLQQNSENMSAEQEYEINLLDDERENLCFLVTFKKEKKTVNKTNIFVSVGFKENNKFYNLKLESDGKICKLGSSSLPEYFRNLKVEVFFNMILGTKEVKMDFRKHIYTKLNEEIVNKNKIEYNVKLKDNDHPFKVEIYTELGEKDLFTIKISNESLKGFFKLGLKNDGSLEEHAFVTPCSDFFKKLSVEQIFDLFINEIQQLSSITHQNIENLYN